MFRCCPLAVPLLLVAALAASPPCVAQSFRFAILGDRTGETLPGIYEQVWRELAAEHPAFVLSAGDNIQGLDDKTAREQWGQLFRTLAPFKAIPLYLTPGNHDVWSSRSASLYSEFSRRPLHYSFDVQQLHVTVLDNSRDDRLTAEEMRFLQDDLKSHSHQPLKIIVSHRPSWLIPVVLSNSNTPFHQLVRKYGVDYVIAGHIHQMLRFQLDGVNYLSMPSAGGHLRASKSYRDGWFFGHTLVNVHGSTVELKIEEANSPAGQGRITRPSDWGPAGLRNRAP